MNFYFIGMGYLYRPEYEPYTDTYAFGLIYLAKHRKTGKVYIGQTIRRLMDRVKRHYTDANRGKRKQYFSNALKKHGINAFCFGIIEYIFIKDKKLLDDREKFWIQHYKSNQKKFGYNMTTGGVQGLKHNKESLKKIQNNANSPAYKEKMSLHHKQLWADEKYREHMHKIRIEIWKRPSYAAKQTERSRGNKNGMTKIWEFTDPNGKIYRVEGSFQSFCKENGLSITSMRCIVEGKRPNGTLINSIYYKGWTVKRLGFLRTLSSSI